MKICRNTKHFIHEFAASLIDEVFKNDIKAWDYSQPYQDIMCGLSHIICQVGEENPKKCEEYLQFVIGKLTTDLGRHLKWIQDYSQQLQA
mmetsp:Transcript_4399/g.7470  ORF Transcript_4399/g.7470 Transcript_4399/m.7470 type:complete len:90 (-) Transcript_4399:1345-1614(-)